ncbi:hypothetical protein KZX46_00255 (plasmid) [Polymorphobacter sp. PAMC 29334]|uniref:Mth938-like domain-containing protein n=1 Tax=Polymorphobacter sp. PAMC 29334 TaxID=2862331 RepID=UPI001C71F462|nr:MTH938/NDUFAF3 family protein [Polymorphobacter sp. PAMC 29334]QYE33285.1 hypothetical protein KZX46_00255 [Polymorphobacter sp. PAMC 29334]
MSTSPKITHLEWGNIEAVGVAATKDLKLFPGGGREWNWDETGTRHKPGIQLSDVQELIDRGSDVVVLTRGMHLKLQTAQETITALKAANIEVHVLETREAASLYNQLAETRRVGGLFHSTC